MMRCVASVIGYDCVFSRCVRWSGPPTFSFSLSLSLSVPSYSSGRKLSDTLSSTCAQPLSFSSASDSCVTSGKSFTNLAPIFTNIFSSAHTFPAIKSNKRTPGMTHYEHLKARAYLCLRASLDVCRNGCRGPGTHAMLTFHPVLPMYPLLHVIRALCTLKLPECP
jgi:hypothetical protein